MSLDLTGVPQELVQAVVHLRPKCPRFGTPKGCKHGRFCKFLHEGQQSTSFDITQAPATSRHKDLEGNVYIVTRPPLAEAWAKLSESHLWMYYWLTVPMVSVGGVRAADRYVQKQHKSIC